MEGKKYDDGKLRWALMPWQQLEQVVRVLMGGSVKYEDFNWEKVLAEPGGHIRYYEAVERHLKEWIKAHRGESGASKIDSDSGLPHLAHAIASCLFLLWGDDQAKLAEGLCDNCMRYEYCETSMSGMPGCIMHLPAERTDDEQL